MGGREAQRRSVDTFVPLKRQGTPDEIAADRRVRDVYLGEAHG